MISAGEFRNGVTFEQDGQVLQVVEFQHVKPGKGAAFVRTKTKNVITGSVVETSYNPTAKFRRLSSSAVRSPTPTRMAICTISWMLRPTTTFLSARLTYPITSSSARENDTCKLLSYKGARFQR